MQISEMEERPPYVRFEQRAVEDRNKTLESGVFSYRDVDYVLVTPHGSRDVHEEKAEQWLEKQRVGSKHGRVPWKHVEYYEHAYKAYKDGLETPENGTPIRGWALISNAQQAQILQSGIRTVEDLASAPEEGLQAIGMGARALKQKAAAWLASAETGKGAAQITELERQLREEVTKNEKQAELIDQLAARLELLESATPQEPKKRGRPKKVVETAES